MTGETGAPRVSAVILFHNEEAFLPEAVESVAGQGFDAYEILMVDGGATPECLAVARALCAQDPSRRRLIQHPDRNAMGVGDLRGFGFSHARGEFLASLDADDVWLPGKATAQVALLDAHPDATMVYGRTEIWSSWDASAAATDFFYDLGLEPDRLVPGDEALRVMIGNRAQTPTTCNAMMRRRVVEQVGGCEARFAGMFEDQALFAKLMAVGPVYVSSQPWARYRQRGVSMSNAASDLATARVRRSLLLWLERWLRAHGQAGRHLRRALRAEQRRAAANLLRLAVKRWLGR
ncbi:glycosyltransferase [Novosphingobium sp. KCTC 2891]|uniref:glycosyltransferase family 2 protein n=1 Tax=Novosphingobium sp. KCTC 2891 TaxID=2989730 RepID=UPI002222E0C7|nr:glycosyltransferase family 2 protein [Novosphingobium sp. KCTC 2891]MCW1382709.1 glycosyltransferase [Novosphingobium sp. KCTC 2891]